MGRRFRTVIAGTTALTVLLVLLGVYTAASGSGLACAQRWPLCDGAVLGLFPATWPSFVEWSHRLVAMITGLAIVGTAVAAWRAREELRIRAATSLAVALLPLQILLGAETVWRYSTTSRAAHFLTALGIVVLLTAATAWAIPGIRRRWIQLALGGAPVFVGLSFTLGPRGALVYSPAVQVVSTLAGLLAVIAFIVAGLRVPSEFGRVRAASLGGLILVAGTLLVRRLVYTDLLLIGDIVATVAAASLGLGALAALRRREKREVPGFSAGFD